MRPAVWIACLCTCAPLLLGGCGRDDVPVSRQTYDASGTPLQALERPQGLPNLIVVVVDSLRADAVPVGPHTMVPGAQARMPWLTSLGAGGVTFTDATAAAPWTLPSMISMLTGLRPSEHGQYQPVANWHLSGAVTTFAEVLRESYGYDTAAFVMGEWFAHSGASLLQGFDQVVPRFALQGLDLTLAKWRIQRGDSRRPFFLLLHTMEAHNPYGAANNPWPPERDGMPPVDPALLAPDADPAEVFRRCWLDADTMLGLSLIMGPALGELCQRYLFRGYADDPRPELAAELRDAYWDGVRWVDGLLGRAHGTLERMGALENTLLVITADHGEAFGEHGNLGHGMQVWDEVIQVPLVLTGPPPFDKPFVVEDEVGLVDLLPTFLEWAGMRPLGGTAGRSFLPLLEGQTWCRPVITEERLTHANTGEPRDAVRISARTNLWKYVVTYDLRSGGVREQLFDLTVDPEELIDLADESGRLPEGLVVDPCLCPAVEAVRDRVWGDRDAPAQRDASSIPYGATAPRAATSRPIPCRGS